ncbi:MAG TPA: nucleotidyl transferase AbiEii/AbiGii toxin family protein [Clostridia bacterium]|mgnify:CR=1 FL=1|jgi:predicted nucleotidyltransferase component of viral defense system|nr:nucleotidyl transferase AbiEii/AbiGii toxin family protein [Clostridiaceae bacterium]HOF26192.1 nucleotidyl transferase AbiEii/AbiGii toxin family protein [Clostridia bacterium]HOM33985.1 nucleotidyl transferase AbiEii/AbiGii toxin family protein [Clostridia bacterium]HOR89437.1 nucleotidyl transferase AbiEii/AbiGii toxin family protein [Clostridia bacterium]HOT69747.1 nucleotidyl transferase AbiEii/AbiGii toxin family protein [Clostridia bacterium]
MIKTARQLKDLIRNVAKGDSGKSQLLFRNYAMERFLERIALSKYRNNFILKGGMLVSSIVGLDMRATMDMDATILNLPLNPEHARIIVEDITAIEIGDNMAFSVKDISNIMDEADYICVRLSLEALLENMRIPFRIDISTGDSIIPKEITYSYKLMFEHRYIPIRAYSLETILAEKIETVLIRTIFNTRLRDFYDIYILQNTRMDIDINILTVALTATCRNRNSEKVLTDYRYILKEIENNPTMREFWISYQRKNSYAADITWETVIKSIRALCDSCIL